MDLQGCTCYSIEYQGRNEGYKTYHHDIAEILLKIALSTINETKPTTNTSKHGHKELM